MYSSRTAPVVAIDIDGTIGSYHPHFVWFAQMYTGRTMEPDWRPEFKGSFSRALHISKPTYREIKLAYRQGGMKRSMPIRPGAAELSRSLRRAGAQVWICTTRPYLRLDSIDPDTRHWLKRNGIHWDHLIYGERKYKDLVAQVDPGRVVAVYDDLPEQVSSAGSLGLPVVMSDGPHNWWFEESPSIPRVGTPEDAKQVILQKLNIWRRSNPW